MKKILFLLCLFLSFNFALADEAVNKIPTDEEIKAAIEKYNFDPSQKEVLFKETKKKLEQLYSMSEEEMKKQIDKEMKNLQ